MNPMGHATDLLALLQDLARATEIPPDQVPSLLGELERLKAALWARLLSPPAGDHGQPEASPEETAPSLLTVRQVADRLCVKPANVYELVRRRELPSVKVGRYVRVRPEGLARWLDQHTAPPAPAPSRPRRQAAPSSPRPAAPPAERP